MVDLPERPHLKLVDGLQPSDIEAEFQPLPHFPWNKRPPHLPLDIEECATALYLAEGVIGRAAERLKVEPLKLTRQIARSPRLTRLHGELVSLLNDKVHEEYIRAFADEDDRRREWAASKVSNTKGFQAHPLAPNANNPQGLPVGSNGPTSRIDYQLGAIPSPLTMRSTRPAMRTSAGCRVAQPVQRVRVPYRPRPHFRALRCMRREKRWVYVVAHRRAGKTVALVNQLIRAANSNTRVTPPPRYAYIGPSFDAAKDLVWGYLKHYTQSIPGIRYLEGELSVTPSAPTKPPSDFTAALWLTSVCVASIWMALFWMNIHFSIRMPLPLLFGLAWLTTGVLPLSAALLLGLDHFHALKLRAEDEPGIGTCSSIPVSSTLATAMLFFASRGGGDASGYVSGRVQSRDVV